MPVRKCRAQTWPLSLLRFSSALTHPPAPTPPSIAHLAPKPDTETTPASEFKPTSRILPRDEPVYGASVPFVDAKTRKQLIKNAPREAQQHPIGLGSDRQFRDTFIKQARGLGLVHKSYIKVLDQLTDFGQPRRWKLTSEGTAIEKRFRFTDPSRAYEFARKVMRLCEEHNHHADFAIRGREVVVLWQTKHGLNEGKALCQDDVEMAEKCGTLAEESGALEKPSTLDATPFTMGEIFIRRPEEMTKKTRDREYTISKRSYHNPVLSLGSLGLAGAEAGTNALEITEVGDRTKQNTGLSREEPNIYFAEQPQRKAP